MFEVGNGEEVLVLMVYEYMVVSVVFIDLCMLVMDGLELVICIKGDECFLFILVVLFSVIFMSNFW